METLEEAKNYIRFLYAQLQELKERDVYMRTALDEIKTELKEANSFSSIAARQVPRMQPYTIPL